MKIYWLIFIVCLSGCQQPKDEALIAWVKHSWAIDLRINGGMPLFFNGLMGPIQYEGKSPDKAAKILAVKEPEHKILGPIIDIHEYLIFIDRDGIPRDATILQSVYCVHAEKAGSNGYIVLQMTLDQNKNGRWSYRFYPEDLFIKMEQNAKNKNRE